MINFKDFGVFWHIVGSFVLVLSFFSMSSMTAQAEEWDNLIILGDSNVDPGNFPRLGVDIPDPPYPGGRFTNSGARLGVEILADRLNIAAANVFNIGFGGARSGPLPDITAEDPDGMITQNHDFEGQVSLLLREPHPFGAAFATVDRPAANARTLVFMGIGGNDFGANTNINIGDDPQCSDTVRYNRGCWNIHGVRNIRTQIERMARAGYTQFAVDGLPDFDVVPGPGSKITTCMREFGAVNDACGIYLRRIVNLANNLLIAELAQIERERGVQIYWTQSGTDFAREIDADPAAFNILDSRRHYLPVACATGDASTSIFTENPTANPNDYLWYDCVHRTGTGHQIWADGVAQDLMTPQPASVVLARATMAEASSRLSSLGPVFLSAGRAHLLRMRSWLIDTSQQGGFDASYVFDDVSYQGSATRIDHEAHGAFFTFKQPIGPFFLGISYEINNGDADSSDDFFAFDTETHTLSFHATAKIDEWLGWGLLSYGQADYDNIRRVTNFASDILPLVSRDDVGLDRFTVGSHADGAVFRFGTGLQYQFSIERWVDLLPEMGLFYQSGKITGFSEQYADGFEISIADQQIESLEMHWGLGISRDWSFSALANVVPSMRTQVRVEYRREWLGGGETATLLWGGVPRAGIAPITSNVKNRDLDQNGLFIEGLLRFGLPNNVQLDLTALGSFGNETGEHLLVGVRLSLPFGARR